MEYIHPADHLKLAAQTLVGFKPAVYQFSGGFGKTTESIYLMVDQFHTLFQHPRRADPAPASGHPHAELIHEEAVTEGIPAAERGLMTVPLDAMADFLYVGVGTMVTGNRRISTGMADHAGEQSVDRFIHTIMVPGGNSADNMAIPFEEAKEAALMLNALADKLEAKPISDSELVQELRRVTDVIIVCHVHEIVPRTASSFFAMEILSSRCKQLMAVT
ncbi:hypothetical protein QM042_02315 [Escherichia coli]